MSRMLGLGILSEDSVFEKRGGKEVCKGLRDGDY